MAESEASINPEERYALVHDVALYILHDDRTFGLIKRQDIVKNILKEKKRQYVDIMNGVKALLLDAMDLELVDIEKNKIYSVANRLNYSSILREDVEADRNLIVLVLIVIFMSNGVISESALFSFLKHIKIMNVKQDKKHSYFGDVESAIKKKFTRWAFLESNVIAGTDPPEHEFRWGKRAELEVDKKGILALACMVIGDTTPEKWEKQCQEIREQYDARVNQSAK